jgi:hypothetical protein
MSKYNSINFFDSISQENLEITAFLPFSPLRNLRLASSINRTIPSFILSGLEESTVITHFSASLSLLAIEKRSTAEAGALLNYRYLQNEEQIHKGKIAAAIDALEGKLEGVKGV